MASLIELGDTAYARFTRTITWGEELLADLQALSTGHLSPGLLAHIDDFFFSSAYCVNFFSDGTALDQVETLGFDARRQVVVEDLRSWSISRLRSTLSMRITLLRKWFDEHLASLGRLESLQHQTLAILAGANGDVSMQRSIIQMRLKLENRLMLDTLDYLRRQGMLEFDKDSDLVTITELGQKEIQKLTARGSRMAQPYRPHDLVFLSYAHEDTQRVREVYDLLEQTGFNLWWDQENLVGGQDWDLEINRTIEEAAVSMVFLSNNSVEKTGYVNKEIKRILDRMDMMPEGKIFIILVRMDDCQIPMRLRQWHVIDYSDSEAKEKIVKAVRHAL